MSQQHRGKTEFCCFPAEKKRAFTGSLVCFPPPPAYRQSQRALQARAKPCKPVPSPASPCSCLCPSTGGANSKRGCEHGQQGHGFPSADLFCCFQQFAAWGVCLFCPHPTQALVSAYSDKEHRFSISESFRKGWNLKLDQLKQKTSHRYVHNIYMN